MTAETITAETSHRPGLTATVRCLPLALLFLAYPLALLFPAGSRVPAVFDFSLPVFFWLTMLALSALLLIPLAPVFATHAPAAGEEARPGRLLQTGLIFLLVYALGNAWLQHSESLLPAIETVGLFAIPLYFAVCPRAWISRRLPLILAVLFLLHTVQCLWQYHLGTTQIVGLSGNRNWAATLSLALAPWAALVAIKARRNWRKTGQSVRRPWLIPSLAAGTLALVAVAVTNSRATWLVLLGYGLLFLLLPRFSRLAQLLLLLGLAGLLCGAWRLWPEKAAAIVAMDIRPPLWAQSVNLIEDHPWVGVGPGNFRREFTLYKSDAHKARPVAAPVTEHPHNEILNLAVALGIPVALLWLLLWLPLFRKPVPGNPFYRCAHFSAFLIFGHALLDKTLVQPPGSLLGLILLGLLWRPRLHLRLQPELQAASIRRWTGPVLALVLILSIVSGGLLAAGSWYGRQGRIREHQRHYDSAYRAYGTATLFASGDISFEYLAGSVANSGLRNPQTALSHLKAVYDRDPNYAHVNSEIGIALGTLGEHRDALPFFTWETTLFPYSPEAWERLLQCQIASGAMNGIETVTARLAAVEHRRLGQLLRDPGEVRRLAGHFLLALEQDDFPAAAREAERALNPLDSGLGDPAFSAFAKAYGLSPDFRFAAFGTADFAYWRQVWSWHQRLRPGTAEAAAIAQCFGSGQLPAPVREHALWRDFFRQLPDPDRARAAAGLLYQAGYEVAELTMNGMALGILEIRQGKDVWLLNPANGDLLRGLSAGQAAESDEVAAAWKLPSGVREELGLQLPVFPAEFCGRNLLLAHLVSAEFGSLAPRAGIMPSIRRYQYQELMRQRHEPQLPVDFAPPPAP